jgi:hypothetical protein
MRRVGSVKEIAKIAIKPAARKIFIYFSNLSSMDSPTPGNVIEAVKAFAGIYSRAMHVDLYGGDYFKGISKIIKEASDDQVATITDKKEGEAIRLWKKLIRS